MELFSISLDIVTLIPIILLIGFLDIELDSRLVLKGIKEGDVPAQGTIKHFFEGIVVFWIYVLLLGLYVAILDFNVWDILPYSFLILSFRFTVHPLYFALRVVVKVSKDRSKWNYLGSTSKTDMFIRWMGFTEKNHYIFRVIISTLLLILFFHFRFWI